MTRLVLHTGTPVSRGRAIRYQLVASREPLTTAGGVLPASDRVVNWDRLVHQLLAGQISPPLQKLLHEATEHDATLVLSSDEAYKTLHKGKSVKKLASVCAANGVHGTVTLVVREQLDLINAFYCQQVMAMETYADFDRFATKAVASGLYHYAQGFRALLDAEDLDVVAIPYSRVEPTEAARAVLRAAGLTDETVSAVIEGAERTASGTRDRLPGPVLVAAVRLLHKRLNRLGVAKKHQRAVMQQMVTALREHALAYRWDDSEFWGWSPEASERAAQAFRFENAEFAAGAWHADWPDAPVMRAPTTLDLASAAPSLVADVFDSIQQVIDDGLPIMSEQASGASAK
jgi:hypothetical protein